MYIKDYNGIKAIIININRCKKKAINTFDTLPNYF